MISKWPFLLKSIYEYLTEIQATVYLEVQCDIAGVQVPESHVEDNRIVLDVSFDAVKDMTWDEKSVHFLAKFPGVVQKIVLPYDAVLALYDHDSGDGIRMMMEEDGGVAWRFFDVAPEEVSQDPPELSDSSEKKAAKKASHLKVIK